MIKFTTFSCHKVIRIRQSEFVRHQFHIHVICTTLSLIKLFQYFSVHKSQTWFCDGVRYFPKGIFPRATFHVKISLVATFQRCNFPSGNFPKVSIGPVRRLRLQWGPNATTRIDIYEVATWENTPWEVATREKFFGKVPNI